MQDIKKLESTQRAIKRNSTTLSRSIYDHSFAVRGPKLWNAIPKNIKCAPSFEVFKSKLTSHLGTATIDPPTIDPPTIDPPTIDPPTIDPLCNYTGVNCREI